jgi:uncharacterized protein
MTPENHLRVLTLPGWQGSGPDHWQSRWQGLHGDERVEQHDWWWPRRGDWMARLDEVVGSAATPVAFVAHSLGCHLVAAWAAHSSFTARIRAALLVAPPDLERESAPPNLHSWRPLVRQRLPFESAAVLSTDDPFGDIAVTRALAGDWGSRIVEIGNRGHVNADSGLADWPEGRRLLAEVSR